MSGLEATIQQKWWKTVMGRKNKEKHRELFSNVYKEWKGLLLPLNSEGTAGYCLSFILSVLQVLIHGTPCQPPSGSLRHDNPPVLLLSHLINLNELRLSSLVRINCWLFYCIMKKVLLCRIAKEGSPELKKKNYPEKSINVSIKMIFTYSLR